MSWLFKNWTINPLSFVQSIFQAVTWSKKSRWPLAVLPIRVIMARICPPCLAWAQTLRVPALSWSNFSYRHRTSNCLRRNSSSWSWSLRSRSWPSSWKSRCSAVKNDWKVDFQGVQRCPCLILEPCPAWSCGLWIVNCKWRLIWYCTLLYYI